MRLSMERLKFGDRKHRSGDPCECDKCRGRLDVANTIIKPALSVRIQYLACNICNWRPDDNKITIPLDLAPPRKRFE